MPITISAIEIKVTRKYTTKEYGKHPYPTGLHALASAYPNEHLIASGEETTTCSFVTKDPIELSDLRDIITKVSTEKGLTPISLL